MSLRRKDSKRRKSSLTKSHTH